MNLGLSGKRALVTGGSQGIGLAVAERLAAEGASVAVCARGASRLREVAAEMMVATGQHIEPIPADLTDPKIFADVVTRAADALGGIDILVNNAGSSQFGRFLEISDDQWSEDFELKFFGFARMARAAMPRLLASSQGRIVNIIGMSAKQPIASHVTGSAANAAALSLTKSLSDEFGPQGVLVNAVLPGPVATERIQRYIQQSASEKGVTIEAARQLLVDTMSLPWMPSPSDVANSVAFLASPAAAYINGAALAIDGGMTKGI